MGRSIELTEAHFWHVLGVVVAAMLIGALLNAALAVGAQHLVGQRREPDDDRARAGRRQRRRVDAHDAVRRRGHRRRSTSTSASATRRSTCRSRWRTRRARRERPRSRRRRSRSSARGTARHPRRPPVPRRPDPATVAPAADLARRPRLDRHRDWIGDVLSHVPPVAVVLALRSRSVLAWSPFIVRRCARSAAPPIRHTQPRRSTAAETEDPAELERAADAAERAGRARRRGAAALPRRAAAPRRSRRDPLPAVGHDQRSTTRARFRHVRRARAHVRRGRVRRARRRTDPTSTPRDANGRASSRAPAGMDRGVERARDRRPRCRSRTRPARRHRAIAWCIGAIIVLNLLARGLDRAVGGNEPSGVAGSSYGTQPTGLAASASAPSPATGIRSSAQRGSLADATLDPAATVFVIEPADAHRGRRRRRCCDFVAAAGGW